MVMGKMYKAKSSNFKRKQTAGQIALKKIRRLENDFEYKSHDSADTSQDISIDGFVVPLTSIAEGDTSITRDGKNVTIKSIEIKAFIKSVSAQNAFLRIALVLSRNGGTPTVDDIYDSSHPQYRSPRNIDQMQRYIVLKEWNKGVFSDASPEWTKVLYYKRLSYKTRYVDNTASAPLSNSLSLIFLSDTPAIGDKPTVSYTVRLRFIDN